MSQYIHVVDWERFQHYRDRWPPWIKSYTELLADDDYLGLSGHRRSILHGLWLAYAMSHGRLSLDTVSLSRRLSLRVTSSDIEALNHAGFVTVTASAQLAPRALTEVEKKEEKKVEQTKPLKPSANGLALVPFTGELEEAVTAPWRVVYDHWAKVRVKPRARPTPKRTKAINTRLLRFTVAELCEAIDNVAFDDWPERAKFDDLVVLMRTDEQVERFLEMAEQRTNGNGKFVSAQQIMDEANRLAMEEAR